MSLQVWLPLTKDLRQQGLSGATVTNNGAVYSSANGKLGGCYNFTNQNIVVPSNSFKSEFTNNQASLAAWVKVTTNHSAYAQALVLGTQGTSWNNILFGIDINGSGTPIANASTGSAYTNLSFGTAIKDGVWHHITYTYNAGTMKVYLDGVQKAITTTSNTPAWTSSTNLYIGGNSGGEKFQNGDSMNDIRVYNHCLSPMEVKELAKGLVLHYPLNRQGWGQENLGNFASVVSNWTMENLSGSNYTDSSYGNVIKLVTSSTNQRMYNYVPASMWQSGKVYTVSFLAKADTNGRTCDMSRSIADFSPTFTLTTNWKRYNGKITSTATPNGGTLSFRIHQSGATVYITQIKVEEGELATPYCPYYNESLYTTMGLNSTTEYDCSGFCNNGTRTGTFSWTSDTPKYEVSTKFNGTDNAIQTPSLPTMITDKNYTIAVWIYKTVIGSKGYQTIYGGPSGFEIEARNGSANETKFVPWNWGKPMASYELNEWNHCVFVHSDADCKIYLNGEYIATGTAKASNPTGNYFVGAWNTATQQNFDGLMSDFRIYATALSADDVKSLYQNSAYIDSSGNVYGAVHSEA